MAKYIFGKFMCKLSGLALGLIIGLVGGMVGTATIMAYTAKDSDIHVTHKSQEETPKKATRTKKTTS